MPPTYKVALIQFSPGALDVKGNFAKAEKYLRDAAAKGSHLAVLPEFHLTSWIPDDENFISASRESALCLAKYQELARELDMNIVPGTICEVHPIIATEQAGKAVELRNMAYFLAAGTGEICGTYQKKNLWHPERPHLTSSGETPHVAFDTPLKHADGRPVRTGMLICWDLAFPEGFRALIKDDADLIIIPSYWYLNDAGEAGLELNPDAEKLFLESACSLRAFENTAAIIFCNAGGLSCVAMPILGPLGKIPIDEEKMEIVDMDLNVLKIAEDNYLVRKDMKSEGWHYSILEKK